MDDDRTGPQHREKKRTDENAKIGRTQDRTHLPGLDTQLGNKNRRDVAHRLQIEAGHYQTEGAENKDANLEAADLTVVDQVGDIHLLNTVHFHQVRGGLWEKRADGTTRFCGSSMNHSSLWGKIIRNVFVLEFCMKRGLQLTLVLSLVLATPSALLAQQGRTSGGRGGGGPSPRTPSIQGQVISDGGRIEHPIEVRLVGSGGQIYDMAFTDGAGNFVFSDIRASSFHYVIVNEPGWQPLRQRLSLGQTGPTGRMPIVVILRPGIPEAEEVGDSTPIDLSELSRNISLEAVEAFEKAAEDSQNGDYEGAAEHLEEAVEIAPDYYEAQYALGVEYLRLDRRDDAIKRFEIAGDLNPNDADPLISLGTVYLQDGDLALDRDQLDLARANLEIALGHLEDAVQRNSLSASGQYYLGIALYRTGSNALAITRFDRALVLDEELHGARLMLSDLYVAQRNFTAALDHLSTYLIEYPESPQREAVERMKADIEQRLSRQ